MSLTTVTTPRGLVRVPAFVVIGGGGIGAGYVRQLLAAVRAGRLATDRILVVDRDPGCAAAALARPPVGLAVAEWSAWLSGGLDEVGPAAHLVPYHWAPHLLVDWLAGQVARAGGVARRGGDVPPQGLPYERTTRAGDRALSYAAWVCPPACIEPTLCPHTRGPKDWSLAADLTGGPAGDGFDDRIVFPCLHLLYGVGTVPVRDVLAARDRILAGLAAGPRRYLVATASHCHGLAGVLTAGGAPPRA
jgi:hypothetical protein